jgi:hypothetical protein
MSSAAAEKMLVQASVNARRPRLFRVAAVLLGFSVIALTELICCVAGWGPDEVGDDPFVGFSSVRPLFEPSADGQSYHTSPGRRGFFKEDSFAIRKPPGEFRVFVFGGSTVQGNPFSIETSFPAYLQIALQQADHRHRWKVVNCGGVSYASYRLLPIMQECLNYEPDLFIFCEGHNEFLEDISYADLRTSTVMPHVYSALSELRSFRLLNQAFRRLSDSAWRWPSSSVAANAAKPILAAEVDTLLDHDGGLDAYHRDDERAGVVVQHFQTNLLRMTGVCRLNGIPLLMILPPSNLSDCPPFKSEFSSTRTPTDTAHIQAQLRESSAIVRTDLSRAIDLLRDVTSLEPRFAFGWYELGQLQLSAGRIAEAEASLRRARDEDVCPLRMTTALEAAMQHVVSRYHVPFINAHQLLAERCPNGIVGENVLVDHVHPSFRGHEDIALAIAEWMMTQGLAREERIGWKESAREECRRQLQSLDDLYFLRGRRALDNLRLWAAGRSGGPPLIKSNSR